MKLTKYQRIKLLTVKLRIMAYAKEYGLTFAEAINEIKSYKPTTKHILLD